jgi:Zn finger protein HypA/HybF involved in hydrogenase expression
MNKEYDIQDVNCLLCNHTFELEMFTGMKCPVCQVYQFLNKSGLMIPKGIDFKARRYKEKGWQLRQ